MKPHGAVMALIALLLAGCAQGVVASPPEPTGSARPPAPTVVPSEASAPSREGPLVGVGMVLDDGSGPELCLGGVAESLPPQCGGIPLRGWTWPAKGVERVGGATWGDAAVVGRWDDKVFAVVKTLDSAEVRRSADAVDEPDFASPCPAPAGGWLAPDPTRATSEDQERVFRSAERLPGYAEAWIDDLGDRNQDPRKIVVNVRVTENLAGAEAELRRVWGGSLCVSEAKRTQTELITVLNELTALSGFLSGSAGRDQVQIDVVFDDGKLQRDVDKKYGAGLVAVSSALQPYPR